MLFLLYFKQFMRDCDETSLSKTFYQIVFVTFVPYLKPSLMKKKYIGLVDYLTQLLLHVAKNDVVIECKSN
jgi:hypothetical protein